MANETQKPIKTRMDELLNQLPKNEPPAPLQKVVPLVTSKPPKEETEFLSGTNLRKSLIKVLKHHAVESGKSMKQITTEAYELYLAEHGLAEHEK